MIVNPVPFTTPDGAERNLRFSQGAKRRIGNRFGARKPIQEIMQEHGEDSIIEIAWLLMFDEDGKPPGITLDRFFETFPPAQMLDLMSSVMSAISNAETPKNEIETLLKKVMTLDTEMLKSEILKMTGSGSGASAGSVSESPSVNSGGLRRGKSKLSLTDTTKNKTALRR
jgi:hypothetical protein